jgi:hypothetical protein
MNCESKDDSDYTECMFKGKEISENRDVYERKLELLSRNQTPLNVVGELPLNMKTIIIFDWDDTLSLLSKIQPYMDDVMEINKEINIPLQLRQELNEIEDVVIKILHLSLEKGDVYIITNSIENWVLRCCEKFYPRILSLLSKIKIISANTVYKRYFPDDPCKWKLYMFKKVINIDLRRLYKIKNIISFGDAEWDRDAILNNIQNVKSEKSFSFIKSVKLAEQPTFNEFIRELNLISNCLYMIINHDGDLDLELNFKYTGDDSDSEEDSNEDYYDIDELDNNLEKDDNPEIDLYIL